MSQYDVLINKSKEAMAFAYAPYSDFYVGAALLTKSGNIYTGCNIENVSFTPTTCAERTAFFKAISEGERDFVAIAICGGKHGVIDDCVMPCGVCRQVMAEFCNPNFKILLINKYGYCEYTLEDILPFGFTKDNLL